MSKELEKSTVLDIFDSFEGNSDLFRRSVNFSVEDVFLNVECEFAVSENVFGYPLWGSFALIGDVF